MKKLPIKNVNQESFQKMKDFCQNELKRELNDFDVVQCYHCLHEKALCNGCQSINLCRQKIRGLYPELLFENDGEVVYRRCEYRKISDQENEYRNNFEVLNMPDKLKEANLKEFRLDNEERRNLLLRGFEILSDYPKTKGLYIHGLFSSGKTYFVAALLNEFSKKGIKSILLYYPDLLRLIRDPYNAVNQELMNKLMNIDVLAIDDLGSENNTLFARDEILSPLLQHRLLANKLTIITSNYDLKQILNHLSIDKNGDNDSMKAARISQRIMDLCDKYALNSKFMDKK